MFRSLGLAAALVFFVMAAAMAQQPAIPSADNGPATIGIGGAPGPVISHRRGTAVAAGEMGQYWLGLRCLPVMAVLRAQLNLPEKQGLLVAAVMPDSPAAKAGVKQHDLLLQVGNKPVADLRDLVQAVEASKGAKLSVELIRGGKRQTVEVTPVKRPAAARPEVPAGADSADWETLHQWMESMMGGGDVQGSNATFRFHVLQPGAIVPQNVLISRSLPKDVLIARPLPKNMSITVSREGDQPAKIMVKRDDQKWEVTEKELDKLPADVRPFAQQVLGLGANAIYVNGLKAVANGPGGYFHLPVPGPEAMQIHPLPGMNEPGLEKRFDEMNRRIDRLIRLVEEMAARDGHHNIPKAKEKK
jgi:membrane-associated protease RseP (regulator of RpoE activity)